MAIMCPIKRQTLELEIRNCPKWSPLSFVNSYLVLLKPVCVTSGLVWGEWSNVSNWKLSVFLPCVSPQPTASLSLSYCLQHRGQEGSSAVCLQGRAWLRAVLHRWDHLWKRWVRLKASQQKGKNKTKHVGWCFPRNKQLLSKAKGWPLGDCWT